VKPASCPRCGHAPKVIHRWVMENRLHGSHPIVGYVRCRAMLCQCTLLGVHELCLKPWTALQIALRWNAGQG
jgi:hypothetical protein